MLRRLAFPLSRRLTTTTTTTQRSLTTAPRQPTRLHHPLGAVPEGTDREQVRAKWGSNAMDKIEHVAPIQVEGNVAICNGGGGALGHPVEYIQLLVSDEHAGPQVCKYCGLKFVKKH